MTGVVDDCSPDAVLVDDVLVDEEEVDAVEAPAAELVLVPGIV